MEPEPTVPVQPVVPNVLLRALVASAGVAVGIFAQAALHGFIESRVASMPVLMLLSAILPVAVYVLRRPLPVLTLVRDFAGGSWAGGTFWFLLTLASAAFA